MRDPQRKVMAIEQALAWRESMRSFTLVVTNGCFDVLHVGHARSLYAARREGDALLVLLNDDASVRALKGDARPVYCAADRAYLLAAMRMVDVVVPFSSLNCAAELRTLAPDVYAKSEEYRTRQDPAEAAALVECGAATVWIPRDPRYSTTQILQEAQVASW